MRLPRHKKANGEEGFVLVFMSLMLVALMVFAAFAVDVGFFYARANKLQRAADAAALAGVVYMPADFAKATQAADDAAKLNGFVDGVNGITVDVERVTDSPRQLEVTIRDAAVPTFFGRVVRESIDMSRQAKGEYVGSIPMGSAFNALGTGTLNDVDYTPDPNDPGIPGDPKLQQNFWLAVNGYCSAKEDGDEVMSKFDGNKKADNPDLGGDATCAKDNSNVVDNTDYNAAGYDYVVDIPCVRADPSTPCDPNGTFPSPVYIDVWNPVFDVNGVYTGNSGYADRRTLQSPATGTGAIAGQNALWQNTNMTTTFTIDPPEEDDPDNNNTSGVGGSTTSFGTCHSVVVDTGVPGMADNLATTSPVCNSSQLGWVTLNSVGITHAGRYKVHVATTANEANSFGMNTFAIRARVGSTYVPCDARQPGSTTTCPSVAGDSTMSVFANQPGTDAEFFLARLAPASEFAGKQVRVRLWDAGEGMSKIGIRDPSGNLATMGGGGLISAVKVVDPGEACTDSTPPAISFLAGWLTVSGSAGTVTCSGKRYGNSPISPLYNYIYNARMLEFTITLPNNYNAGGSADGWWKIDYQAPAAGTVSDRTTWEVQLVGDPVHLRQS